MELLKLIEWQREYGYTENLELISELLIGVLNDVEPFVSKLRFETSNNASINIRYRTTYSHYYKHKGVSLSYWYTEGQDHVKCLFSIKELNSNIFTRQIRFNVPDEQTAILYLSKLYTFSDLLIGRPQRIHYIPKVKDKCKLREFNDFKHYKASYKKVAAGGRSEFVSDIHSSNRTDERIKLNKLKLNPTDYYDFNFATKITRQFSTYGGRTNYVMWPGRIDYNCKWDLEWYKKYKRK